MSTKWASLCSAVVALGLAFAMILVGYDGNDEFTCDELAIGTSHPGPSLDYATIEATLGILKKQCPAEYRVARKVLTDAGYYR